jgi:hypothetical protein
VSGGLYERFWILVVKSWHPIAGVFAATLVSDEKASISQFLDVALCGRHRTFRNPRL